MTDRRHATLAQDTPEAMLKMVLDREAATAARHDDRIEKLKAERDALAEENERLRKRVKDMSSDIRIGYIHCEALAEIKATVDGKSDQPVADIISSCIAAVAAYRTTLAELKGQGDD